MSSHASKRSAARAGVLAALSLAACTPRTGQISGTVIFDELLGLQRAGPTDTAVRTLQVNPGDLAVVFVDELGFDVSLRLGATDVENSQKGEGIEIAVAEAPAEGKISFELHGPPSFDAPGQVRVRVETFGVESLRDPATHQRVDAYRAWMRATTAMNAEAVVMTGDPEIRHAIGILESNVAGDARLAAQARAVRARMFYEFEVDWRESAREANRAAAAFLAMTTPDALAAARSRRMEATALQEVAAGSKETDAARRAADIEARRLYAELLGPSSALDDVGKGRVLNDLGLMDWGAQNLAQAQVNFEGALAHYVRARYSAGVSQTARNLVLRAMRRGDFLAASRAYEVQLAALDSIPDPDARASLLINAALADVNVGATDRAIERLLRASDIAQSAKLENARIRAMIILGEAYWARGDTEQANALFDQILRDDQRNLDAATRLKALRVHGDCLRDTGDHRKALRLHQRALEFAANPLERMRVFTELSRDLGLLEDTPGALAAARRALQQPLDAENHPALVEARLALADALVASAESNASARPQAREIAAQALAAAQSGSNQPAEVAAHRVLARVALAEGDRVTAAAEFERGIELVLAYSTQSANPELQASTRASQQQLFRDYLDLAMSGDDDEALRAFTVLENVRRMNFLASRGGVGAGGDSQLSRLLADLAGRHVRMAELTNSLQASARDLETLRFEMATLRAQIDGLRGAAGAPLAASADPSHESWRIASPGRVQISFALGRERAWIWQRTATGWQARPLRAGAAAIRAAALGVARLSPMQYPERYDAALLKLSGLVLPAGIVNARAQSVEIVADDELAFIPFAALRSPSDAARRLGETHVVQMLPSLLALEAPRTGQAARRWRLVTVRGDDSRSGTLMRGRSSLFPPLPGARIEVSAIQARFGAHADASTKGRLRELDGAGASIEQVRTSLEEGAEIAHFATHGLADSRQPLASLLVLPGALLTAGEIQQWRGNVGLVFLSACETAVGPPRFAEGMPGLQRAFLRAGARDVIATLWPVEDQLATEFAQVFYEELEHGGSHAEALARAQRRWMSSGNGDSPQMLIRKRVAAWGYVLYSR